MGIEFRLLGPLEVRLDGTPLQIGGPRQRALLAMLLLSANRVVSRDRLIDELLPDASPATADHQLRVQISRLRRALCSNGREDKRLVTQSPGYLLEVAPGELDLHLFEQLVNEGDRALAEQNFEQAATKLRDAELLWRGRPLADLEFEPFARVDVERLQDLRLVATQNRIESELALGRHAMLVPELEGLVAEYPLRERLRGQLMLALYRCGRQADALELYRTGRSLLSEELALEPSPALRQLEQSILRQEAALDLLQSEPGAVATQVRPIPAGAPAAERGEVDSGLPRPPRRNRRLALGAIVLAGALLTAGVVVLVGGGSSPPTASANSVGAIDTSANALRTVVPVGGPPGGIAVGYGAVWETDTANDQLLEISRTGRVMERVPVGRGPTGVATGGGEVWVVNQLDRTVSEINPRALRQVASFAVGSGANAVAFGDGSVWVANVLDDTVSRINPATRSAVTISLAGEPGGIAVGAHGVWVASASTGQLLLIDPETGQITQQQQIGGSPAGVAVGAGSVWVANTAEATVSRFRPDTGAVTNFNVGKAPLGIAYGAGAAWAADSLGGTVARIDPGSNPVRLIRVGAAPSAVAINGRQLWTTVLAGPAAHRGGTIRVAQVGGPFDPVGRSLEPAEFAGLPQWQMLSMTNDGLVTYKRVGGLAGGTLVPDLATSLPAPTDNGRTYTFQLRGGIHYSNGALVRPDDFREEIERIFKLGNGYGEAFYAGIVGANRCMRAPRKCSLARGIVADDKANTVTFHLTAPDSDFLYKLAFPWADAVPAGTPDRTLRSMPPATGPYTTVSITRSRLIIAPGHPLAFHTWTLVRNRRFRAWNPAAQPNGYPSKIVLTAGQNPDRAVSEAERGHLDALFTVPPNGLSGLAAHYTGRFHSEPSGGTFGPVMNTRVAPFNDVSVRRALNYAIDRRHIVSLAGGPLAAQPTCQILPPTLPGYVPYCPYTLRPNASGSWRAPDLPKAQKLIDSSGTRGMKVTLIVQPNDATNPTAKIGPYLVSVLDRLGYRASLRVTNNLYPTLNNSRSHVQMGWFNWYQDYPAPSDFIAVLLTCGSFLPANPANTNDAEFCSRKIDNEVKAARSLQASDPGAASKAWRRIDQQVTDQAPWLTLYNPRVNVMTSPRVGNYQYHPFFLLLLDQLWVR